MIIGNRTSEASGGNFTNGAEILGSTAKDAGEANLTFPYQSKEMYGLAEDEQEYIFDRYSVQVIFIILYTIVFFLCVFGNLLVLLVVTLHWRMRSITKFCMANLAFADFCVGIFCVYQNLSTYLISSWFLGEFLCKMQQFINGLSHTASILTLMVVSVERYLAIVHPLQCRRIMTKTRIRLVVGTVWFISGVYCSPRLYYMVTLTVPIWNKHGTEIICTARRTLYDSRTFDMVNSILLFVLPLVLMVVLYCRMALVLWESTSTNSLLYSSNLTVKNSNEEVNTESHNTSPVRGQDRVEVINLTLEKGGIISSGSSSFLAVSQFHPSISAQEPEEIQTVNQYNESRQLNGSKEADRCFEGNAMGKVHGPNAIGKIHGPNAIGKIHEPNAIGKIHGPNAIGKIHEPNAIGKIHGPKAITTLNGLAVIDRFYESNSISCFHEPNELLGGAKEPKGNHILGIHTVIETPSEVPGSQHKAVESRESNETLNSLKQVVDRYPNSLPMMKRNVQGSGKDEGLKSRQSVIKMFFVIVVIFALCNLPYHLRKIAVYWCPNFDLVSVYNTLALPVTHLCQYANCAINPIIYSFMSSNFRSCLKDLISCRLKRQFRRQNRVSRFNVGREHNKHDMMTS